jgi:hypothetical protein
MNKWKFLAIVFSLFCFGALSETVRIFTSDAPDIAPNRTGLSIMAVALTSIIIFFTIRFWKKAWEKS